MMARKTRSSVASQGDPAARGESGSMGTQARASRPPAGQAAPELGGGMAEHAIAFRVAADAR